LAPLLWWLFTQDMGAMRSALFGAIAVVVPSAVMAWGVARRPATQAGAALFSVMLWELIKILLVIAILVAVVKWVPDLRWAAMLSTLVVCLKVNWLVLLLRGRFKSISDGN
jgi:ATP synthase protein I